MESFKMEQWIARMQERAESAEKAIRFLTPKSGIEIEAITKACEYSLFSGGKRVRPILAGLAGELFGAPFAHIAPVAVALEFIHTYSLIPRRLAGHGTTTTSGAESPRCTRSSERPTLSWLAMRF